MPDAFCLRELTITVAEEALPIRLRPCSYCTCVRTFSSFYKRTSTLMSLRRIFACNCLRSSNSYFKRFSFSICLARSRISYSNLFIYPSLAACRKAAFFSASCASRTALLFALRLTISATDVYSISCTSSPPLTQ